jgi:hypothetical protein
MLGLKALAHVLSWWKPLDKLEGILIGLVEDDREKNALIYLYALIYVSLNYPNDLRAPKSLETPMPFMLRHMKR